jgi:hypothetical protein
MVFQTGAMRLSSIEIAQAYAVESRLSCIYAYDSTRGYQSAYCMEPGSTTSTATLLPPASRKHYHKRPELDHTPLPVPTQNRVAKGVQLQIHSMPRRSTLNRII